MENQNNKQKISPFLLIAIIVAVLFAVAVTIGYLYLKNKESKNISNFDECVAAGNPVMESYPRQCTAEGKVFVEEIENDTELANPASTFCEEQGGNLELRNTEDGQIGYCVFDDGSECEEWSFFRGECEAGNR